MTRVFLIDRVAGEYRFVARGQAPSTFAPPWSDMTASVRQALNQVSEMSGRRFLDEQDPVCPTPPEVKEEGPTSPEPAGGTEERPAAPPPAGGIEGGQIIHPGPGVGGVDAVVAITSASERLRLMLTGITNRASLDTARRALPISCAVVEGLVSSDRRDAQVLCDDFEGQVCLIQELAPDAIVMVGGVDGGAGEPVLQSARAVAWAFSYAPVLRDGDAAPAEGPGSAHVPVIFAGNAELCDRVAKILGPDVELRIVDNVRPSMEVENPGPLQAEIEELHRKHKMMRLPGYGKLATWSSEPVIPAARAYAHTIQYLASSDSINVLGVDVGGATTMAATVVDGQFDLAVRDDLGLSHHAARILDNVPVESVLRWLPPGMQSTEVYNALYNKELRSHTLPQTRLDLLLEHAVAREVLRLTVAGIAPRWSRMGRHGALPDARSLSRGGAHPHAELPPKFHLIVGGGGVLSNTPDYALAALVLLDALQPVGITGLALDTLGILTPLAAVARVNPLAAAQVLERDALFKLGTVVAPVGLAREGEIALTCKIEYQDGRSLETVVACGSLQVIPLPAGQTADLELRPTRHFDVGLGTRGLAGTTTVEGGALGIIFDARGRPLPLATDLAEQRQMVERWLWDIGA